MTETPDPLRIHAESNGDGAAVLVDEAGGARPSTTTFAALNGMVNRCANAFHALGARRGERIVWCGPNSLEVLVAIHAARKAGMVAVPLSYRFNAEEMQYVIDNSDATLMVVDSEQAPTVASIRERLPKVREIVGFGGGLPAGAREWDEVLGNESDAEPAGAADDPREVAGAQMIYTSGTTGRPKGALRTTTAPGVVLALLMELRLRFMEEVHLTTGPLYHSGPLAFAVLSHAQGSPVVVLRKFDPQAWLRLVSEHHVTNTFSAPTQLKRIVSLPPDALDRADLSSMRCLIANAAPVPYALKEEISDKLGDEFLFEVYGSTELGIVTVLAPEDQLRKPGSCGKPYGGIDVKIARDDGSEADVGEPGELFIRTALAMDGYHRTDEQLAELAESDWKSVGDVADRLPVDLGQLRELLVSAVIAVHRQRGSDEELAGLTDVRFRAVVACDLHVDSAVGLAARPRLAQLVLRRKHRHDAELRRPVDLEQELVAELVADLLLEGCLLYTSPSPRD